MLKPQINEILENNNLIEISIDDIDYWTKPNISIIEACASVGIIVPRFCYHELLSVSGNCRLCLVEIDGIDKPQPACVAEVTENAAIYLNSPFSKKARENVLELILLHHPIDCPICDQAGECDLQDQSRNLSNKISRFYFKKNTTEDKYCGPLIRTIMTRCITCTRCVRFADEIAGVSYFGTINRGENTEIGPYIKKLFDSELSGNVVDLCPVGALNSKPETNKYRPWNLKLMEGIDTTDALGSRIYIEYKESTIARISPRASLELNTSLISDKARYSYDSETLNRFSSPFKSNNVSTTGDHAPVSWSFLVKNFIPSLKYEFIVCSDTDANVLNTLVNITRKLPNIKVSTFDSVYKKNVQILNNFNAITNIATADTFLFIGTNPKTECSVLNAKIKFKLSTDFCSVVTGGLTSIRYNNDYSILPSNTNSLFRVLTGKHSMAKVLSPRNQYLFIFGPNIADFIEDYSFFNSRFKSNVVLEKNSKTTFIPTKSNQEGLHTFNIEQVSPSALKNNIILFNINSKVAVAKNLLNSTISYNFSTHYSSFYHQRADYVVPTATIFGLKNDALFLNLEHRPQSVGYFLESSSIKSTADFLIETSLCSGKKDKHMFAYLEYISTLNPEIFEKFNTISEYIFDSIFVDFYAYKKSTKISVFPTYQKLKNFYQTNTQTLNSKIMEKCTEEKRKIFNNFN